VLRSFESSQIKNPKSEARRTNLHRRDAARLRRNQTEKPVHFPSYRRKPVSIPVYSALAKAYAEPVSRTTTQRGFRLSPE
jgi:hypothetical protein